MNEWFEFFKQVGMPFGLVVFFVWRGSKREDQLVSALEKQNAAAEDKNKKLIELVERGQDAQLRQAEAQMKQAEAQLQVAKSVDGLKDEIREFIESRRSGS